MLQRRGAPLRSGRDCEIRDYSGPADHPEMLPGERTSLRHRLRVSAEPSRRLPGMYINKYY